MTTLPKTKKGLDMVWVVVDNLTKVTDFISLKMGCSLEKLVETHIQEIVRLHGVPLTIVFDRDTRFTSHF